MPTGTTAFDQCVLRQHHELADELRDLLPILILMENVLDTPSDDGESHDDAIGSSFDPTGPRVVLCSNLGAALRF